MKPSTETLIEQISIGSVPAYAELVAVRVGQHDGAVRTDLDASGPEADQPIDLRLLVATGRGEVDALPVPKFLRGQRRASPMRPLCRRAVTG